MTAIFKDDPDNVKVNQLAKYISHGLAGSAGSTIIVGTHKHRADCSTRTAKTVDKTPILSRTTFKSVNRQSPVRCAECWRRAMKIRHQRDGPNATSLLRDDHVGGCYYHYSCNHAGTTHSPPCPSPPAAHSFFELAAAARCNR